MFLHGYLADSNSFAYQYPFFEKEFNIFAPDLKGFGGNKDMEYPYSLDDYVLEVEEFIKANNMVKPHVVAHSFGGRIAIKLAAKNKDLLGKIVLTGAAGLKPKPSLVKILKRATFNALKVVVKKEKLKGFYSKDYQALSPIMRESFIKIVNEHLDDKLSLIENPVLVVNGKKDKETPVYMAKRLNSKIRNSKLLLLDNAGHFSFIDKPNKFNVEVKEFLLS